MSEASAEAFPVLLTCVKQEPDEDFPANVSFDEGDSQISQAYSINEVEPEPDPEADLDLDYIITTEDGEELEYYESGSYDYDHEVHQDPSFVPNKAKPRSRKRNSKMSPKRRRRCGQCGPCQVKQNCGECKNCVNRSVLKQSCIFRKCLYLRKAIKPVMPNQNSTFNLHPDESSGIIGQDNLMTDDTAMLERPMVLLSPERKESVSPDSQIHQPYAGNLDMALEDTDNAISDKFVSQQERIMHIDPVKEVGGSIPALSVDQEPNIPEDSVENEQDFTPFNVQVSSLPTDVANQASNMENATRGNVLNQSALGPFSHEQPFRTADPLTAELPENEPQDTGDKNETSADFFQKRILNTDTDETEEQANPTAPAKASQDFNKTQSTQDLPNTTVSVQSTPDMRQIQHEILRNKLRERSLSRENSKENFLSGNANPGDTSNYMTETGNYMAETGKPIPSWKAFGSYNKGERSVIQGILENVSKRKKNNPKRVKSDDVKGHQDKPKKPRRQSRECLSTELPPFPHGSAHDHIPPPHVVPNSQYLDPGLQRLPYPMFDKGVQGFPPPSNFPYELPPRHMCPPIHPPYFMERFPGHPFQGFPDQIRPDLRHGMSNGMFPPRNNCQGKLTPPPRSDSSFCPPFSSMEQFRPPSLSSGEKFAPCSRPSSNSDSTSSKVDGQRKSPFSHFNVHEPIPPVPMLEMHQQRPPFHPDSQSVMPPAPGTRFCGFDRPPDIRPQHPNQEMFARMYEPRHFQPGFNGPRPDANPERFHYPPWQAPRMFSPWMPNGFPMNMQYPRLQNPFSRPELPVSPPVPAPNRPPPPLKSRFDPPHPRNGFRAPGTPEDLRHRFPPPDCFRPKSHPGPLQSPELQRPPMMVEGKRMTSPPIDAHLKRYLDDVFQNRACSPSRPSSEPNKTAQNPSSPSRIGSDFEQEMISIDDFHVSAYIRADGANSVEIEFDQNSLVSENRSVVQSPSSSDMSSVSRKRCISGPSGMVRNPKSARIDPVVPKVKELLVHGKTFQLGLMGQPKDDIVLKQDLGDEGILQMEIPGKKCSVENVLLEADVLSSSSNVDELLKFLTVKNSNADQTC